MLFIFYNKISISTNKKLDALAHRSLFGIFSRMVANKVAVDNSEYGQFNWLNS